MSDSRRSKLVSHASRDAERNEALETYASRAGIRSAIDANTYETIRHLVRSQSGIELGEDRANLVVARLYRRMRQLDIHDLRTYVRRLQSPLGDVEIPLLIDAISTNVTSFYREREHFEFLEQACRTHLERGATRLRLWSAGCSTGEEAYSMAIVAHEATSFYEADARILATDINRTALAAANRGTYDSQRIKPVAPHLRHHFFDRTEDGGWSVQKQLQDSVRFGQLNLSKTPFPMNTPFEVIFCRNVLIYFGIELRQRIINEFVRLLSFGGHLVLGHAENLLGCKTPLKQVKPSIYVKE